MEWYNNAGEDEKNELLKNSSQIWQSYLMLRNADKDQFKTLVDHLQNQYALGTDQFLKTTTSAADVMGAHEVQNQNKKMKREKNEKTKKTTKTIKTQEQIKDQQITHPRRE